MKSGAAGPGRGVPHDMRDELCPACTESDSDHQNDVDTWIACSHCGTWYHVVCVRLTNWDDYDKWYCKTCRDSLPLEPKMRAPRRRSHRMDIAVALDIARAADFTHTRPSSHDTRPRKPGFTYTRHANAATAHDYPGCGAARWTRHACGSD